MEHIFLRIKGSRRFSLLVCGSTTAEDVSFLLKTVLTRHDVSVVQRLFLHIQQVEGPVESQTHLYLVYHDAV